MNAMTDERLAYLRNFMDGVDERGGTVWHDAYHGLRDLLAEVGRLRALLDARREPDAARPVTWAREAEIRKEVGMFAEQENRDYGELLVTTEMMVDSLALLDHERHGRGVDVAILTDALTGDGRYDAGHAAGVAAALAQVQAMIDEEDKYLRVSPLRSRHRVQAFVAVKGVIEETCAPAPAPPHLVTLAECARMRAALAEIVKIYGTPNTDVRDDWENMHRVAREALDGTP